MVAQPVLDLKRFTCRVDVTTPEGRFFAVEVTHEVIFDRKHRIRPGFQDFVRYDCRNDFPGRIEILSTIEQDVERSPASGLLSEQPPEEPQHEVAEQQAVEADVQSYPETGRGPEGETNSEPSPFRLEPQPVRKRGGLLAAWLGRRR
jgi:hypothetical protein